MQPRRPCCKPAGAPLVPQADQIVLFARRRAGGCGPSLLERTPTRRVAWGFSAAASQAQGGGASVPSASVPLLSAVLLAAVLLGGACGSATSRQPAAPRGTAAPQSSAAPAAPA